MCDLWNVEKTKYFASRLLKSNTRKNGFEKWGKFVERRRLEKPGEGIPHRFLVKLKCTSHAEGGCQYAEQINSRYFCSWLLGYNLFLVVYCKPFLVHLMVIRLHYQY
jgi:hypothetical protein